MKRHAENPYTLTFGKVPSQTIPRHLQKAEVVDALCRDHPSQQAFMITGVRGAGKTVFMAEIAQDMRSRPDWIFVELNPEKDMTHELAAKLCSYNALSKIFRSASINLSLLGLGVGLKTGDPIADIDTALERMFASLKKAGRKVLISIDEVTSSKEMRIFVHTFQTLVKNDMPIYLIMTGLYENIENLQNQRTMTFLYRAPKIILRPLRIDAIAENYRSVLEVDEETSLKMARSTYGYPYAFQLLGYFVWEYGDDPASVQPRYRDYLEEYVYDKIWSELSEQDKAVLNAIASSTDSKVGAVREQLQMSANLFNQYRRRLIRKGLIDGEEFGHVHLTLPLFAQYIKSHMYDAGDGRWL